VDPVRLGLAFRALRRRRGWTQAQLAEHARVSRGAIQRVERGGAESFTGSLLRGLAVALGARFEQRLLWQGEALDRLLDADHARLVEIVISWLRAEGWEVAPEVTFAIGGERGSIDVLAFHAASGTLLVVEVKTVVPDMQAMLGGVDRKARLAMRVARSRGWHAKVVGRLLVLPDDRTSRRRVASHAATLDAALPARTREVRRWARSPVGALAGVLFVANAGVSGARHRVAPRSEHR
jgi:transcriptional regulator with XRE-family HTH domain